MDSPSMISKMPEGKSSGSKSPATGLIQMDVDSPRYQRELQLASSFGPSPSAQEHLVAKHDTRFLEQELIPESSRLTRLPNEVPSSTNSFQSHPTGIAISAHQNTTHTIYSGHDVHFSVNNPASLPSSSASRNFGQPSTPPETSVSSFSQPLTQHVINHPIRRPRTSTKVFESTTDLAVHYGIPQILPPLPQTTSRYNNNPSNPQARPVDFLEIRSNYLNMLSDNKKPTAAPTMSYDTTLPPAQTPEPGTLASSNAPAEPPILTESELQTIVDIIGEPEVSRVYSTPPSYEVAAASTPQLNDSDFIDNQTWDPTSPLIPDLDYNTDYGVSPDETPLDDFLETPAWADQAMLTSPGMDFIYNDFDSNQPLIMSSSDVYNHDEIAIKAPGPMGSYDSLSKAQEHQMPNFDSLIAFSPHVQLPDTFPTFHPPPPTFIAPQPPVQNSTATKRRGAAQGDSAGPSRTRPRATGHRQGITAADLLSEDAPTQPRNYVTPSATSRKEVPVTFARKRARSMVDDDEDLEDLPPDATQAQQIAHKRRQNTVAARRSRQRKLDQHVKLKASRDEEREFKECWERRAKDLLAVLREKGFNYPDFPPDVPKHADAN